MKRLIVCAFCMALAVPPLALAQDKGGAGGGAPAAPKAAEMTPEQKAERDRFRTCHKQAMEKKLRGDEHKNFLEACTKR